MSNKNRPLVCMSVKRPAARSFTFATTSFTLGLLLMASASIHAQVQPDAGSILEGTKEKKPVPKPAPQVLEVKPTPLVPEVVEAKPLPKAAPKAPEVMEAKPAPKAAPKAPEVIEAKLPKPVTPEQMELSRLQAENVQLKREIEILKKATAYSAKDAPAPTSAAEAKPAPAPVAKAPSIAVKVSGFKITGNTAFPEAELAALIADNVGKELSFEDLSQVPAKISAHYRGKGYFLAQAYLPAQDIKGGVVEIDVLEGTVGEVKLNMSKNSRLRESVASGILGAIKPGELIQEESLERALLLLNDFPGVTVKSTLQPGAYVGEADVVADVSTGSLITGSVELDNWGSRFTSEHRIGGVVNINNPTGYGDLFTIRALAPIQTGSAPGELYVGRISYLLPVGSLGTKLGVAYALLNYKLGRNDFSALGADGEGEITSLFALHPFIRTRNFNLFAIAGYDVKDLEDRVAITRLVDAKRVDLAKITLSSDFRDGLFGGGLNTLSLSYSSGKADLKTAAIKTTDQAVLGRKTDGSFEKFNYEFQRLQQLQENISLLVALSGQKASKNLVSAEKFSLGGATGVRAYPPGEAGGDEGSILSAELRWNVPQLEWIPANVMVSAFVDQGNVQTNKITLATDRGNQRRLLGYGLGLNVGKPNDYLLRSSIAWHVSEEPTSDTAVRDPRLFVQLTKWF